MKACVRRNDFMLVGIRESRGNSDERLTADWSKAQIIAKAKIILHMGSQPQVRAGGIIDDDRKRLTTFDCLGEYLCKDKHPGGPESQT